MPSSYLILCRPLLLLPPIPPSIRVFSNELTLHRRWPKYWSFSFSISPSKEHPGMVSFRMDWLDLLAIQGTVKSLLQHHSSKASILRRSAFFTVQLSHPYMTTGKTIALTRWTFVGKIISLLFNMLSRLVITFLSRSKRLLISWLQSSSAVILEPPKIKSLTVSTVSPSICHEVMGLDAMILVFWMLSFKSTFSLSSFTFIKRLFSSSLLSAIRVVSSACLRVLMFLPAILIPVCASSRPAFPMMHLPQAGEQHTAHDPWLTPEQDSKQHSLQRWLSLEFQFSKVNCLLTLKKIIIFLRVIWQNPESWHYIIHKGPQHNPKLLDICRKGKKLYTR